MRKNSIKIAFITLSLNVSAVTGLFLAFDAEASPAGQFYVGGQVGVLHGEPSGNMVVNNIAGPPADTLGDAQSFSENNLAVGIFGGYEHAVPFGFLSIEGFYNDESSSYKKDSTLDGPIFDIALSTQLKKYNTFGATVKVGWNLPKTSLAPYLSMSMMNSDFSFSYNSIDPLGGANNANGQQKRNLWAFAPGGGLAYPINDRITLRLDYQYRFYQEWNLRNVNTLGTTAGLTSNLRIRDQQLMGGVLYRF
jgi:opacity protein-like surface antigen